MLKIFNISKKCIISVKLMTQVLEHCLSIVLPEKHLLLYY